MSAQVKHWMFQHRTWRQTVSFKQCQDFYKLIMFPDKWCILQFKMYKCLVLGGSVCSDAVPHILASSAFQFSSHPWVPAPTSASWDQSCGIPSSPPRISLALCLTFLIQHILFIIFHSPFFAAPVIFPFVPRWHILFYIVSLRLLRTIQHVKVEN